MSNCKILDCTLRDGGYYNNWDFSSVVVNNYLISMAEANIEFVELGLRNFPRNTFLGAFAYTTESFINSLKLPDGPQYGVMIDAKTILESGLDVKEAIDKLFVIKSKSKLSLVRVAAHFTEVEKSKEIVEYFKELGYQVGFNLMQAAGKPTKVISAMAKIITDWEVLDVLYFADSLGNMDSLEVVRIIKAIKENWKGELGIHTHNNMGKGLDNSLTAINNDVTWIDSTITGMGRGAGNTPTEYLLAAIGDKNPKYEPKTIYELAIRYFQPMQKKYGWGSSLLYFLGAQNNIHPTYIQNLLSNSHYGTDEIVGAIDYLSQLDGTTSYNGVVLDTALSFSDNNNVVSGNTELIGLFEGKEVLLVANGPSTSKYSSAVESYIERVQPIVISVNIIEGISQEVVDYYIISHNSKFLSEGSLYKKLNSPIILPLHRFSDKEKCELEFSNLVDYGLSVEDNILSIKGSYSVIPFDLTIAYALSILIESKPKKLSLIGFDGYEMNDPRQQEMIELLNLFQAIEDAPETTSLTPTSYPIKKGSIYAPII